MANGALSGIAGAAGQLLGPDIVQAFNPSVGLQVTPAVFQSVEQEGRWKPASLVAPGSSARQFELAGHAETSSPPKPKLHERYAPLKQASATLFKISMPAPSNPLKFLGPLLGDIGSLMSDSSLTIYATWWTDGMEIWGGYAGLAQATGFLSVYHHRANISLQAIPFGNYYPALALITWSGWVSGYDYDHYFEFRGAIVVRADDQVLGTDVGDIDIMDVVPGAPVGAPSGDPGYMTCWTRQPGAKQKRLTWTDRGFVLDGSMRAGS